MIIEYGKIDRNRYPLDGYILDTKGEKEPIAYRITKDIQVTSEFVNKIEQLRYVGQLLVYGDKKLAKGDIIILHNNARLQVVGWTPIYFARNIYYRDLLKPKVKEILVDIE